MFTKDKVVIRLSTKSVVRFLHTRIQIRQLFASMSIDTIPNLLFHKIDLKISPDLSTNKASKVQLDVPADRQ